MRFTLDLDINLDKLDYEDCFDFSDCIYVAVNKAKHEIQSAIANEVKQKVLQDKSVQECIERNRKAILEDVKNGVLG